MLVTEQYGTNADHRVSPAFPPHDKIADAETQLLSENKLTAKEFNEIADLLRHNLARYCLLGTVPVFDNLNLHSQTFSSNEQFVLSLACCVSTNARF